MTTASPGLVVRAHRADDPAEVDRLRGHLDQCHPGAGHPLTLQCYDLLPTSTVTHQFMAALSQYTFVTAGHDELIVCNLPPTGPTDGAAWEHVGEIYYALVDYTSGGYLWAGTEHDTYLAAVHRYLLTGSAGIYPTDYWETACEDTAAFKRYRPEVAYQDVDRGRLAADTAQFVRRSASRVPLADVDTGRRS